jgi:hypothetical protein
MVLSFYKLFLKALDMDIFEATTAGYRPIKRVNRNTAAG